MPIYVPSPPMGEPLESFNYQDWFYKLREMYELKYITPVSLTNNGAGAITGTISNVQTLGDGNTLVIAENIASPYLQVDFTFNNISKPIAVIIKHEYAGSASHIIYVRGYNQLRGTWDILGKIVNRDSAGIQTNQAYHFPNPRDFVLNGQTLVRVDHVSSGIGTHTLTIDYMAIISHGVK